MIYLYILLGYYLFGVVFMLVLAHYYSVFNKITEVVGELLILALIWPLFAGSMIYYRIADKIRGQ